MAAVIINNDHWMCRAMGDCWCQQMMSLLCETRDLNTLLEFGEPAAGESAPISPEVPQAPVEFYNETQDTITEWANTTFGPADSNIRIAARANEEMAELLRALSADDDNPKAAEEIADVVIVLYRVASRLGYDLHELIDKKMEINRGRKWKLDNTGHGYHVRDKSVTTPATPSAAVGASEPVLRTWTEKDFADPGPFADQGPFAPAESPDDWVTQDRVPARVALDEYRVSGSQSEPGVWKRCIYGTFPIVNGYQHGRPLVTATGNATLELRCRRKDLPVVPDKSHALPSPWRPMTEKPTCDWFWLVWKGGDMSVFHRLDDIPFYGAIAWQLIEKPQYPNAAPADKPRMRQVTLREYRRGSGSYWTTSASDGVLRLTGRTAVVEVPE